MGKFRETNLLLKGLELFVLLLAVLFDFFLSFGACVFYALGAVCWVGEGR